MDKPIKPVIFPADEYLSPTEVSSLWDVLAEQLQDALNETREEIQQFTEQRDVDADHLDLAVTESNRDFELRLADRERRLIRKVKLAMERISEGSYGTCEACGNPIGYARLMARPVAVQCIDCKTEAEQLERPRRATH